MNPENISALLHLLSFAFGAGGAYFMIKQSRKDVNGLGRKVHGEIRKSSSRHQNITLALMTLATKEQQEKISDLLKETQEEPE